MKEGNQLAVLSLYCGQIQGQPEEPHVNSGGGPQTYEKVDCLYICSSKNLHHQILEDTNDPIWVSESQIIVDYCVVDERLSAILNDKLKLSKRRKGTAHQPSALVCWWMWPASLHPCPPNMFHPDHPGLGHRGELRTSSNCLRNMISLDQLLNGGYIIGYDNALLDWTGYATYSEFPFFFLFIVFFCNFPTRLTRCQNKFSGMLA